jgi:hypothetical protein
VRERLAARRQWPGWITPPGPLRALRSVFPFCAPLVILAPMLDEQRIKLLFGPYHLPAVGIGDLSFC